MTRMLYLRDVLELVNHRLYDGALSSQQLVRQAHQLVLHIPFGLGIELNAASLEQLQG